jgi:hypothetical protein
MGLGAKSFMPLHQVPSEFPYSVSEENFISFMSVCSIVCTFSNNRSPYVNCKIFCRHSRDVWNSNSCLEQLWWFSNSRLMAQEQLDRICPWFSIIMILPSGQGPLKEIYVTMIFILLVDVTKCFWQTKISQPYDFWLSIVQILRWPSTLDNESQRN